jgi:hypothetical protein
MPMKKLILCGAMLLLMGGFVVECQAQSKEETLQWIKQRLPTATAVREDNNGEGPGIDESLAYQDVVVSGCSLTFVEKVNSRMYHIYLDPWVIETVITVPLGRLSKVDSVHGTDGGWNNADSVELKAYDKIITWKDTAKLTKPAHPETTPVTYESHSGSKREYDIVVTGNPDLAMRLAKALAHANELCVDKSAKKEPF